MAKKISELTASGALSGTEQVPLVQSGVTVRTTAQDIADLAAGGVTSVNTLTGAVTLQVGDGSIGSTGTNLLAYSNAANELSNLSGWNVDPNYFGLSVGVTQNVIDDGYHNWNYSNLSLEPTIASPTTTWVHDGKQISIDTLSGGFALGTNGQAALFQNYYYSHLGTSDTGSLWYMSMSANIGNGTDPITVGAMQGAIFFPAIDDNVTFTNQMVGFTFSPNAQATSVFSSGITAFQDSPNFLGPISGYTSFSSSPQLAEISNNTNYAGINLNPQVTTMTGNAGATLFAASGTFATIGTSGFRGVSVSTNITTLSSNSSGVQVSAQTTSGTADWSALDVNNQNINSTGIIRGLQIQTDVALNTFAIDAAGHNNLSCDFEIVDGQGQVYGNVIGGEVRVPDGAAITGSDVLANNMAFTVNTGNASSSFTAASLVGLTTLGFVGQIIGDGDVTGGITFCLNGYSMAANTGTIDRINNFTAAAIPGGGTATILESVLFYGLQPFGYVATDNWGLRIDTELENYVTKLAVGDMASKKVTNASVGLELSSVTKAFLNARMTTTERDALTAVNGMQVYNTTTDKLQVYAAGSWVDLH